MPIGKVWIYRLLLVCLFVCTVTNFFAEDKPSDVKFCTTVRRTSRGGNLQFVVTFANFSNAAPRTPVVVSHHGFRQNQQTRAPANEISQLPRDWLMWRRKPRFLIGTLQLRYSRAPYWSVCGLSACMPPCRCVCLSLSVAGSAEVFCFIAPWGRRSPIVACIDAVLWANIGRCWQGVLVIDDLRTCLDRPPRFP